MPRPDLAELNVNYRRIPILAIGKDIYCDSRLIIQKLQERYPDGALTPSSPIDQGIKRLLESWTVDGGVFQNSVKLIPYWHSKGNLQDTKFLDDRQKLMGGKRMTAEEMEKGRPDGLVHIRQAFELVESTLLADGRKWILGTEGPTTADIDGVWPFMWTIMDPNMKGCLPEDFISEKKFPRTYEWVRRFNDAVKERQTDGSRPTKLDGKQVKDGILKTTADPESPAFIQDDPLGYSKGDEVEVYPSDYGFTHKDRGVLVGLTLSEVVIRNSQGFHLHFPRWNFRIAKVDAKASIPAPISTSSAIPQMRLIYHHGSPFVRKVFMLALELDLTKFITLQKVVVCPVPFPGWSDNNDDVAVYNPMAKIPCLIPEDVPDGIYDSRIICEYLEGVAGVKRKVDRWHWQLRSLHACADGIMDACVLVVYEKRIREPKGLKLDEWVEGQQAKIFRALDRLETAVSQGILQDPPNTGPASADEVAVVAALGALESINAAAIFNLEWRSGRLGLVGWYEIWEKRKSFVETPPSREWDAARHMTGVSKI
jgi:glutathione S-transferase